MHSKKRFNVKVKDLLGAGLLHAGDVFQCEPRKDELYTATLQSNGSVVFNGTNFGSLSGWVKHVAGNSRNGWRDVRARGRKLGDYRDDYLRGREKSRLTSTNGVESDVQRAAAAVVTDSVPVAGETPGTSVREDLLQKLHDLTPVQFEHLVARFLKAFGFTDVLVTGKPGDRTIDGECLAPLTQLKTAYQAKRLDPSASVNHQLIQQFLGSIRNRAFSAGIYVTTGHYTGGARDEERLAGGLVRLIDGEELVKLLLEKRLGVKDVVVQAEIDEEFFGSLG